MTTSATSEQRASPWGFADDRALICIPGSAGSSLQGFCEWVTSPDFPERVRASYLDGEIQLEMSPEEYSTHSAVKTAISGALFHLARQLKLGRFHLDGVQIANEDAELSTEPDGMFILYDSFRSGKIRLRPRPGFPDQSMLLEGTPDMVLEVVSRWSVLKDTKRLVEMYHKAGITEYWLIDARYEEVEFDILIHEPDGYHPSTTPEGLRRSQVFGRSFRLTREIDEAGHPDYTLEVVEP